jgi:hypothetical protein
LAELAVDAGQLDLLNVRWNRSNGWSGSGTVLYFTAMSGDSITDTGLSCRNGTCALLSRPSVDLLQRRQSTLSGHFE